MNIVNQYNNGYQRVNLKKIFILLLIGGFLFLLVNYLLTNSRLELQNTMNEEIVVFIEGDNNYQQKLDLGPNETKTLRLKKANYRLDVARDGKQSRYATDLGFLWQKSSTKIELLEPKASVLLGKSTSKCGREIDNKPIFYSCSPSSAGFIESAGSITLSPNIKGEQPSSDEEITEDNSTLAMKPYKNIFLEAKKINNNLFISKRGISGYVNNPIKIEGFDSEINDEVFSVNDSTSVYSVLDKQNNRIIYGNIDRQEQEIIDLSEKKIEYDHTEVIIKSTQNKIFLLMFLTQDHVHNESGEEDADNTETESSIIIYALGGKEEETVKFEKNSFVYGVSSGPHDLVFLTTGERESVSLLNEDSSIMSLAGYGINTRPTCWTDENTFYYQSDEGNSIYEYSLSNRAAYLVYKNNSSDDFVEGISCADGSLYFSVNSQRDGETDTLYHYKLGEKPQIGKPIEEAFPRYFEIDDNTYKATLASSDKINVELILDAANDGPSSKAKVRKVLFDDLGFEGVSVKEITIKYSD